MISQRTQISVDERPVGSLVTVTYKCRKLETVDGQSLELNR